MREYVSGSEQNEGSARRRILLIDDDSLVLNYSRASLVEKSDVIVSMARGIEEATSLLQEFRFDLVFAEFHLRNVDFPSLIECCVSLNPEGKVVAFTSSECARDAAKALEAGAKGYVVKSIDHLDLLTVADAVLEGGTVISDSVSRGLFERGKDKALTKPRWFNIAAGLTDTEAKVLECLCRGLSNYEISYSCGFSVATVKKHISTLLAAFDVQTRLKLVCKVADFHRPETISISK